MNKLERLRLAGAIAATVRQQRSRRITTVNSDGASVRVVSSRDLAASTLARAEIEFGGLSLDGSEYCKVCSSRLKPNARKRGTCWTCPIECDRCGDRFVGKSNQPALKRCPKCRFCKCGKELRCEANSPLCRRCTIAQSNAAKAETARVKAERRRSKRPSLCERCSRPLSSKGNLLCHGCAAWLAAKKCTLCGEPRPKRNKTGICGDCWPNLSVEDKRQLRVVRSASRSMPPGGPR